MIHQPKSLPKSELQHFLDKHNFLTQFNYDTDGFNGLQDEWKIYWQDTLVKDRIEVLVDDPENPYEKKDITPLHPTKALFFDLNKINHINFNFYVYEDYADPTLVYFHPAVYYYGNYVKDYFYGLVNGTFDGSVNQITFFKWCQALKNGGDNFAMHNYKIDMETVSKYKLME